MIGCLSLVCVWFAANVATAAVTEQKIATVSEWVAYSHAPSKPYFRSKRFGKTDGSEAVRLIVLVDEAGNVESALPKRGRRQVFHNVEEAMKRTKFQPFLENGKATPARFEYELGIVPPERWEKPRIPFPVIQNWKTFHARLERRTCHRRDNCLWYSIEVNGDGTIAYSGTRGTTIPGLHHDHISRQAVMSLYEEFKHADYCSLRTTYLLDMIHGEGAFTSVAFDGKQKSVDDFQGQNVGAPDVLEALEKAFDRIAGSRKWVWGNPDTARSLKAERCNFQAETEQNDQIFLNSFERGPKELTDFLLSQPMLSQHHLACMLGAAAANGDVMLFQSVLKLGINPNDSACHGRGGVTALMRAMESRQSEIIRILLMYHPDVNLKGMRGQTFLMTYLRLEGKREQPDLAWRAVASIVSSFIKAGADINARDSEGRNVLYYGCGKPGEIWDKLVKAGGDVHVRDAYGRTLLMFCGDPDTIKRLLSLNPDLRAKDRNGKTVLDLALERREWKKVALLLKALVH